jgi:hypothetical protein
MATNETLIEETNAYWRKEQIEAELTHPDCDKIRLVENYDPARNERYYTCESWSPQTGDWLYIPHSLTFSRDKADETFTRLAWKPTSQPTKTVIREL